MPKTITLKSVKKSLPRRNPLSHKGQNGRVLLIGGSQDLVGAPALSALAALATLRIGSDLCTLAAPQKVGWAIHKYSPDLIVRKFSGKIFTKKHLKDLLALEKNSNVTLIGPGIGKNRKTLFLARKFCEKAKNPLVIDADAIGACRKIRFKTKALITPHAKEFEQFSGIDISKMSLKEKISSAKKVAAKSNCTILLKGPTDIITDGKTTYLNTTGNAAMTIGGTGDILAGICAGLISQRADPISAAGAGAYVNGKIGEELFSKSGYGLIASDFLALIPKWTKRILK
ncbi:MAG TPA: NAD(P)H-hydrate dehydratase [archaeon]|nr:NAD(P)H-hydrate dehydratase [archaeon]